MEQRAGEPGVAVLGRYAGVVHVLADLLRVQGLDVPLRWAADDPDAAARPAPAALAGLRVVVTLAPGDPTLHDLRVDGLTGPVVAITWHPDDELVVPPGPTDVVRAGRVRADTADRVRAIPVAE